MVITYNLPIGQRSCFEQRGHLHKLLINSSWVTPIVFLHVNMSSQLLLQGYIAHGSSVYICTLSHSQTQGIACSVINLAVRHTCTSKSLLYSKCTCRALLYQYNCSSTLVRVPFSDTFLPHGGMDIWRGYVPLLPSSCFNQIYNHVISHSLINLFHFFFSLRNVWSIYLPTLLPIFLHTSYG